MLGLVARADQRGIGIMTAEFYKHMKPDKTLIVSHGQWPQDFDQYVRPGAPLPYPTALNLKDLSLDEETCREFLKGLDVAYCVETLYDWRFKQWAEDAGCRVVIHGMPELYSTGDHERGRPQPDEWLWPTPWLIDDLPDGSILNVPCAWGEAAQADPYNPGPLHILHTAGVRAAEDRNGTVTFMEALRYVHEPVHATIVTQDTGLPGGLARVPSNVEVSVITGGYKNRWEMYDHQHLLVLPRKYGGLCLPALEAMSCGLALALPRVSPNGMWPNLPIEINGTHGHLAPFGYVPSAVVPARSVAKTIDQLAADRGALAVYQQLSREYAASHSWEKLKPEYDRVLT